MRRLLVGLAAAALLVTSMTASVSATHVSPSLVAWVPGSEQAKCDGGIKIEPVESGTYPMDFGGFPGSITITVRSTSLGKVFDFTTDSVYHKVTSVAVKGGPDYSNLYSYGTGIQSDTGLHSPDNANSGKYYGLSHLCIFRVKTSG